MPYRFIEDEAPADVAFEAWGKGLEEVFKDAAEATVTVMVRNIDSVRPRESRLIEADNDELDLLLFDLLQQLLYYKDAEQLLLRITEADIDRRNGAWHLRALGSGEKLDQQRHEQGADVKAVTLHDFSLKQRDGLWRAHVILDI